MKNIYDLFLNPHNIYRPVPFWSWNDDLEENEIRRQVREMKKGGYGGYFMHSRVGLVTPYLKESWMKMINIANDEGKKQNIDSWLYDEDKWPSGFAGGEIPKQNPEFRFKYIVCTTNQQIEGILKDNLRSQLSLILDESFILNHFTKDNLLSNKVIGDTVYHFYEWVTPLGDSWYNGTTYVDLMNSDCVKSFIDSTYELYFKECGSNFGKSIPGIFTDEPCIWYHTKSPFKCIPWSNKFRERFKKMNNYDIFDHLIQLFIDHENYQSIRYDYYKTLSELFVESFSKQIYDWCNDHEIIFTGHYLMEDNLFDQITAISSVMPHYEFESFPGIDMLGNKVGIIGTYLTIKQCSSVAEQLGKKRVLSETYGGGGWNLSLKSQKLMAEVQLALGVNYFTPHLCLYSMRGERKRDFPPSLYYQQPYWDDYVLFNDFISRLCAILSQGKRSLEVLVIHPIESAWLEYIPSERSKLEKKNQDLFELTENLLNNQTDFHFGDEYLLSKYGKVENAELKIGEMSYKYIILPNLVTLRMSTINLLKEFAKNGGIIFCVGDFPKLIDGKKEYIPDLHYSGFNKEDFYQKLTEIIPGDISFIGKNSKNILVCKKIIDDEEVFFILNKSDTEFAEVQCNFSSSSECFEEWDPKDGKRYHFEVESNGNNKSFNLDLCPGQSILLYGSILKHEILPPKKYIKGLEKNIAELDGDWRIENSSLNCMTLDFCQYKIDGSGLSKILPVIKIQKDLNKFGGKKITLQFEFEIEAAPNTFREIYLVAEKNDSVCVKINNTILNFDNNSWWLDISFKKVLITDFIRNGLNFIEFEAEINDKLELESVYIIGDFLLKNYNNRLFSMISRENILATKDFVSQGYPFFAGKIAVTKTFEIPEDSYEKCFIRFSNIDSMMTNVIVNGQYSGSIAWEPQELDITNWVKKGSNAITLELISSCRNLLGPHHLRIEDPSFIGPEHFYDLENWDNKYKFVPFGLTAPLEIVMY